MVHPILMFYGHANDRTVDGHYAVCRMQLTRILVALLVLAGNACVGQGENKDLVKFDQLRDWAGIGHFAVYPNNPLLQPGAKGEWDAGAMGSMTVLKVGEVLHLYYEAWGVRSDNARDYSSLQIGHATSRDGLH